MLITHIYSTLKCTVIFFPPCIWIYPCLRSSGQPANDTSGPNPGLHSCLNQRHWLEGSLDYFFIIARKLVIKLRFILCEIGSLTYFSPHIFTWKCYCSVKQAPWNQRPDANATAQSFENCRKWIKNTKERGIIKCKASVQKGSKQ